MKTIIRAKTRTPVYIGEVVSDNRGRRYYVSHVHNNKLAVVSMDGRKLHITADPVVFNCYLTN